MYFKGPVVVVAAVAVETATPTGPGSIISACIDPKILFSNQRNALVGKGKGSCMRARDIRH